VIVVAGHLRVAPRDRASFLERSASAVALARAAPGCLDFVVGPDLVDDARVNVFERWTDRASLAAFRGSGPDDDTGALIAEYRIEEFEVISRGSR
jgi:quinol monooxygenase YgiN